MEHQWILPGEKPSEVVPMQETKAGPFLTSAGNGGEWPTSHPGHLNPREKAPGTHCIGGWVGARACLDILEKRKSLALPGCGTPDCLAHSLVTMSTLLSWLLVKLSARSPTNILCHRHGHVSAKNGPTLPALT